MKRAVLAIQCICSGIPANDSKCRAANSNNRGSRNWKPLLLERVYRRLQARHSGGFLRSSLSKEVSIAIGFVWLFFIH